MPKGEKKRILLINPNTNGTTTDAMLGIARKAASDFMQIEAVTAPQGVSMITTPEALEQAGSVLADMIPILCQENWDGVIIAAYGDPGLVMLRRGLDCPVTGIGEASMLEAAQFGPFAVVTTTPDLAASISAMADSHGVTPDFQGVTLTPGDALTVTSNPLLLVEALEKACLQALRDADKPLTSLIIGGGPLAVAARTLKNRLPVRLIEPIPAAVRRIELMISSV